MHDDTKIDSEVYDAECGDALTAALANRAFLYTYLWRLFAQEPDEALLDVAADGHTLEACMLLAGEDSQAANMQEVVGERARAAKESPDAFDALKGDYMTLLVGPGKLPAPPWESVYACGEDLLFQESTLEVRQAFLSAGYRASGYPHEADDHLATEMNFMAALSERAQTAYEEGDIERVRESLSRQLRFLSEHLNAWLPQFADRMNKNAKPGTGAFYPSAAYAAVDVCRADAAVVAELIEALS